VGAGALFPPLGVSIQMFDKKTKEEKKKRKKQPIYKKIIIKTSSFYTFLA